MHTVDRVNKVECCIQNIILKHAQHIIFIPNDQSTTSNRSDIQSAHPRQINKNTKVRLISQHNLSIYQELPTKHTGIRERKKTCSYIISLQVRIIVQKKLHSLTRKVKCKCIIFNSSAV